MRQQQPPSIGVGSSGDTRAADSLFKARIARPVAASRRQSTGGHGVGPVARAMAELKPAARIRLSSVVMGLVLERHCLHGGQRLAQTLDPALAHILRRDSGRWRKCGAIRALAVVKVAVFHADDFHKPSPRSAQATRLIRRSSRASVT